MLATVAIATMHHIGFAQVLIPDLQVRTWLNETIPGIVDANGIMDTSHVGIADVDTLIWTTVPWGPTDFDLEGIQYLDSLVRFTLSTGEFLDDTVFVQCPAVSGALRSLELLSMSAANYTVPVLREPLERLLLTSDGPYSFDVSIAGIEDTLTSLQLHGVHELVVGNVDGYVGTLLYGAVHPTANDTVALAPFHCGHLFLDNRAFESSVVYGTAALDADWITVDGWVRLGSWPVGVSRIDLESTYWASVLPSFPTTLRRLEVHNIQQCIPYLPEGVEEINLANVPCIPNVPSTLTTAYGAFISAGDTAYCSILNTTCPGTFAAVAGRNFVDADADGVLDPGELPMPWGSVVIQPGNKLAGSTASGWWERAVFTGEHTMTPSTTYPYVTSISPAQHLATITSAGEVDSLNHFAYQLEPDVQDLEVHLHAAPARPGFANPVWLSYRNYGTTTTPAQLTFTLDADQDWTSSSVPPGSINGQVLAWTLPNLGFGDEGTIQLELSTPVDVALGTVIQHHLSIGLEASDATPTNNSATWNALVVGSFDPNDKLIAPGTLPPSVVQAGEAEITYTIRFQNTGNASASRVIILDTLSTRLHWNTFRFLAASHACTPYIDDGVLHFVLDPIDLPDSTSDEARSHGFVKFAMRPSELLQDGDTILNTAHIVFDFNEPVVTPPAVFTVDLAAGMRPTPPVRALIHPNPVGERLRVVDADGGNASLHFAIRDASGRLMRSGRTTYGAWIDVAELDAGSYVLHIVDEHGERSARFIVQ